MFPRTYFPSGYFAGSYFARQPGLRGSVRMADGQQTAVGLFEKALENVRLAQSSLSDLHLADEASGLLLMDDSVVVVALSADEV